MDNLIKQPILGNMSQGTFFSCAVAEDYSDCLVHGIIITARCDIAQSKISMYNYVPVVCLNDWIHRDGRLIFCDRAMKEVKNGMRNALKTSGHADSILQTATPEKILENLFQINASDRSSVQKHNKFRDLVEQHNAIISCVDNQLPRGSIVLLGERYQSIRASMIKELIEQRLSGYYFFSHIEPNEEDLALSQASCGNAKQNKAVDVVDDTSEQCLRPLREVGACR